MFVFVRSLSTVYKKDGNRQRNVRQFLHILASPGYAPGQSRLMLHGLKED